MGEVAVNLPLDSNEIKEIATHEFRKRLDGLSPLMGAKEYAGFDLDFQVKIRLRRTGASTAPTETLAWANVKAGDLSGADLDAVMEEAAIAGETFTSKDPNTERMERGMLMTVETTGSNGAKTRRKVKIKE